MASFREKEKEKDLSWFENDDVFGFGSDWSETFKFQNV